MKLLCTTIITVLLFSLCCLFTCFFCGRVLYAGLHLENFLRGGGKSQAFKMGGGGDNPSWWVWGHAPPEFFYFRPPENASGVYFKS